QRHDHRLLRDHSGTSDRAALRPRRRQDAGQRRASWHRRAAGYSAVRLHLGAQFRPHGRHYAAPAGARRHPCLTIARGSVTLRRIAMTTTPQLFSTGLTVPTTSSTMPRASLCPGDLPLVLLPVRLETRFFPQAGGATELRVRIYPDKIHLDSHERSL